MKLKILPSAHRDLLAGYKFYEKQSKGVGSYFLDTLFSEIDSLVLYAGVHPIFYGMYHRVISKRFPFAVYYQLEEGTLIVCAVLDCRRNPAWIRKRLN